MAPSGRGLARQSRDWGRERIRFAVRWSKFFSPSVSFADSSLIRGSLLGRSRAGVYSPAAVPDRDPVPPGRRRRRPLQLHEQRFPGCRGGCPRRPSTVLVSTYVPINETARSAQKRPPLGGGWHGRAVTGGESLSSQHSSSPKFSLPQSASLTAPSSEGAFWGAPAPDGLCCSKGKGKQGGKKPP